MSLSSAALGSEARPRNPQCVLHDVGPYHEVLSLSPLEVFADTWQLTVESLLDKARDPSRARVRYTTTLEREAMSRLCDAIEEALRGKPYAPLALGRVTATAGSPR